MMSSAARDPYWRSRVARESSAAGTNAAKVQDKCLTCHAAADQYAFRIEGKLMRLVDLTDSGREGVTCTVCHRIDPSGLGDRSSFTGGFRINDGSLIFGPHERPFAMPMIHHTGYEPVSSKHMLEAALCGSCHTLLLTDGTGQVVVPEQTTYLEWLASGFPARNTTCQTCHVPVVRDTDGKPVSDYIAHRPPGGPFPPTSPRSPIGGHGFLGGNVQMQRLLGGPEDATRQFLSSALALEASASLEGRDLMVKVTVRNLTGHKLPTGLPGRRLWVHVTALDSNNQAIFESGGWNPASGELRYLQAFQKHRDLIDRPDQTAIYEAVTEDARGVLTNLLTKAVRYRKDNRLLPAGFDRRSRLPQGVVPDWIAPTGTNGDADFDAGQDTVHYRIPLTKSAGRLRVSVEACFQSIPPAEAVSITGLDRAPTAIAATHVVVTDH